MAQFAEVNVVMAVDRDGVWKVFKIDNSIQNVQYVSIAAIEISRLKGTIEMVM